MTDSMPSTDTRELVGELTMAMAEADTMLGWARVRYSVLRDLRDALLRSPVERGEGERCEEELSRLYRILGMGGFAGEAPEELFLVGDTDLGCDAWLDPVRYVVGQPVLQHMTNPVRYRRADLASPPAPAAGSEEREWQLHRALAFAAYCIKSGEGWSPTCEEIIGAALRGQGEG